MEKDPTKLRAIRGDVSQGCKSLADSSVDLCIFSPPYKVSDGWHAALMLSVGDMLYRVLKPGARAHMVFGQLKNDFARPWESASLIVSGSNSRAIKAKEPPLEVGQTIIWAKSVAVTDDRGKLVQRGHYQPINPKANVLNYGFEFVFTFKRPGPDRTIDRLGIGVLFTDKTNMDRVNRGDNGDLHCAGDVWFIPYETTGHTTKKKHPHQFPLELARRLIVLNRLKPGSLIFDPFLGGGTTAVAARMQGHNCVGYEIDAARIKEARAYWKEYEGERWKLKGARV